MCHFSHDKIKVVNYSAFSLCPHYVRFYHHHSIFFLKKKWKCKRTSYENQQSPDSNLCSLIFRSENLSAVRLPANSTTFWITGLQLWAMDQDLCKGRIVISFWIYWIRNLVGIRGRGSREVGHWLWCIFSLLVIMMQVQVWGSLVLTFQQKCCKSQCLLIDAIKPWTSQGIYYSAEINVLQRSDPYPGNIPAIAWLNDQVFHIWLGI